MTKMNEKETYRESTLMMVLRILLGLVFIFSSTMKGIDPMGTAYRVEDYLGAYNMLWLGGFELAISYLLICVEFLIGVALLFKLQAKLATVGVLLMMIFFTFITYIDAKYEMVPDCGCFGDAVKLTAWQTFYKNIVLIVMALIVFFGRKKMVISMASWVQTLILIGFGVGYVLFMNYNLNHLPMIDFRDWEIGKDMKTENEDGGVTYLIYQNKETGEMKEYISPNYPWNDSVWMSEWEFVDQRYDESGIIRKHNLIIENQKGANFTKAIIENPEYQLLLVSYDIDEASGEAMLNAFDLFESTKNHKVSVALITASGPEAYAKYMEVYNMRYPIFFADGTELKAMIRSNPGLILLKDGIVLNKWHANDFPKTWKEALLDGK
jgi:uncharacterized membrane protein YphA (DoxX/SURF4 family)